MPHLVLYDGVCGLCDRLVRFLLRIDHHDRLLFAALQGPIGAEILKKAGRTADSLSTLIVVADYRSPSERLLVRSEAGLFAVVAAGGIYRAANVLRIFPPILRDAAYDLIASQRYRVFGRFDACPVPSPKTRAKFPDFANRGA